MATRILMQANLKAILDICSNKVRRQELINLHVISASTF
jgi:hypothetical protein